MNFVKGILLTNFLLVLSFVNGQVNSDTRAGSYLIRNYSSKEHGGNAQIFDITQDGRGVMYFGNQLGVLEYDGVNWNKIFVGDEENIVHSLATNSEGRVIIGATGDFGELTPDSSGNLGFNSWLVSSGVDSIGEVKDIICIDDVIYLKTDYRVLKLQDQKLSNQVFSETGFLGMGYVKGSIYVLEEEKGIFKYNDGKIESIPGGELFKDKFVVGIVEYNSEFLIITDTHGIYRFNDDGVIDLVTSLAEYEIFSVYLSDNLLRLGTFSHGVISLNKDFEVVSEVGLSKGIADATIKCQFRDAEGTLWIGTNVGVTKVSINEPVLLYGKQSGLKSGVESIERFGKHLYIATQNGVYALKDNHIEKIPGLEKDCYGVKALNFGEDSLLIISEVNDVVAMSENGELKVIQTGGPYDVAKSPLNDNELIILHYNGIAKVRYENGSYNEVNYLKDFSSAEPFNFLIEEDGTIWIGTLNQDGYGVFQGHVNMFEEDSPSFVHYGAENGLPQGASYLYRNNGELYVGNDQGMFKKEGDQFKLYNGFGFDFSSKHYGVHRVNEDKNGNVWMILYDRDNNYYYGFSKPTENGYVWVDMPFKRYSNEIMHAVFHEENTSWIGGPAGLLRYDITNQLEYNIAFKAIIRKLKFGEETYYGGADYSDEVSKITLNYSSNKALGFEFSSSSYVDESSTEYSVFMEGQDSDWSDWTTRTIKEYNLGHGSYIFHVKARNIYGTISEEAVFEITILPPWYQTTWAYIIYFVLTVLLVFGVIRLSIYRIKQKNIHLEQIVKERTQEVVVQKEEAEKQRDLAEQQKQIADHQKHLVEEKNNEILDSINYAKRIQEAIMPSVSALAEALPQGFLLYMPKDVVAGDFFWMERIDDVVYYAAADCTGHGVPGAMVSVVCSNALTKALLEDDIRDTGKLLDRTREIVIERLARSGEEVKDGMDISLCALNRKTNEMQWSGANNPLWILRNGANEIEETKPDKQPIGLFDRFTPFTSHNIQLNEGDTIYIFTDGYQDQFGGPKAKKFKPMNVKKLIIENAEKSMNEQQAIMKETFIEWMRDLEQIDDVCVIGVRI